MKFLKIVFPILFCLFLVNGALAQSPGTAKLHYDNGLLDKAKDVIDQAVQNEKNAAKSKTWYFYGLIYAGIANDGTGLYGELDDDPVTKAYDAFKKAMEMEPDKKGSYKAAEKAIVDLYAPALNFGISQFNDEEYDAAYKTFVLAQKLNDKDTLATMLAATAAFSNEKYEEFELNVKKILEMDLSDSTLLRNSTLYVSYLLENDKKPEGLALIEKSLATYKRESNPEMYDILERNLIPIYVELNRVDDAIAQIKKNIAKEPEKSGNYYNLGVLYDEKEDFEQAEKNYKLAIEKDEHNDKAIFNLGAIHFNRGVNILKEGEDLDFATAEGEAKYAELEKEANVHFKEAMPYFEKLNSLYERSSEVDNDRKLAILFRLREIYKRLEISDKLKVVDAKIKVLDPEADE